MSSFGFDIIEEVSYSFDKAANSSLKIPMYSNNHWETHIGSFDKKIINIAQQQIANAIT
jgi:hypothetical protein